MSNYLISDLHFGHNYMRELRGFSSVEEMNQIMIERINQTVSNQDVLYILGDVVWRPKDFDLVLQLQGIKKIVLGNHDGRTSKQYHTIGIKCYGAITFPKVILTHVPIHPDCFGKRFKINYHGHLHDKKLNDSRYVNVSWEQLNGYPLEVPDLKTRGK